MAITRRGFGIGLGTAVVLGSRASAQAPTAPRRITAAPAQLALLPPPASPSEILAFDGHFVGPELRLRQGDTLRLELDNRLAEPLRLAFPGLRGQASTPPLAPGASTSLDLRPRDAGTLWFRPQDLAQRSRGLAGVLIIEESAPPPVDRDLVVVIKDLLIDASGRVAPADADPSRLGLVLTIAGRPEPLTLTARPNERLRLRLINASTGLILPIAPDPAITLLARDGMPTEAIAPNDLTLAPGNRADLVIDAGASGHTRQVALSFGGRVLPIVQIRAEGEAVRPAPLPAPTALRANAVGTQLDLARARRTSLAIAGTDALTVNGRGSGEQRPVLTARRGETLVFQFENHTALPLVLHVSGQHLRPLDALDDGWKPWLLDTLLVDPGGRLLAACRAEFSGRWPIEAHTAAPRPIRAECMFEVG